MEDFAKAAKDNSNIHLSLSTELSAYTPCNHTPYAMRLNAIRIYVVGKCAQPARILIVDFEENNT